ncbi:MAG: hypothetical protein QOD39_2654 [Mycobacterium sp.]|jgi:hypothetical protein|nr:hypothetical protein [Mycobacterium sp.]
MAPLGNAKQAWAVLAAGVLAYELGCKEGELLSEGVDDWLAVKPLLTRTVIAALALHLGNAVPPQLDPISLGFQGIRRASRFVSVQRRN